MLLGLFWLLILRWISIVPKTLLTLFQYVYDFWPKHCKQSILDILWNQVSGVQFEGYLGESDNFDSLARWHFTHNFIARRTSQNKKLSAKRATRSLTAIVHECPMAYISSISPTLSRYQTYVTFQDTSMERKVIDSE
jgi:hypothetical protein